MNFTKIKSLVRIPLALLVGLLVGRMLFSSSEPHPHASAHATDSGSSAETWTCSMHPQIQQPESGDCPICGMDLIPLEKDSGNDEGPRSLRMSEASRALAEIQTTLVRRDFPEAQIRLVGKLAVDETREKSISARFPARIDELFVNYNGIRVKAGEHLARVYSPELLTAQRELLTAYRADQNSSLTRAAREKLRLWDLLPEQVDEILERGEATDTFVLKAPIGGVVVEKHVKEGDYLKQGQPLFRIADLTTLWLKLEAFESEIPWLRFGQDVSFTVESLPGETFHGILAFIEPEVDAKTRTVSIRVNVPNADERLKPGMFARATVVSRLTEDGRVVAPIYAGKWISPMHPEIVKDGPGSCDVCGMDLVPAEELGFVDDITREAPLLVPASAVLRTGKRAVVYLQNPDVERPTFEGREIVLGPRAGDVYLVVAGLMEGERVVTQGAFKIDSALQIQAKPSMMNPKGGGPAPGHNHGGASTKAANPHAGHTMKSALEIPREQSAALLESYLALQSALAADDLGSAQTQIKAMMAITGHTGALADLLHTMLGAENLDALRKPHFETLSMAMIASVKDTPQLQKPNLHVIRCPMVYGDRGADWLQVGDQVNNPYFGAAMLTCGDVKEVLSHD